jgi:hypothetical protein
MEPAPAGDKEEKEKYSLTEARRHGEKINILLFSFVAKRLYRAGGVPTGYKPFATPAPPECGLNSVSKGLQHAP